MVINIGNGDYSWFMYGEQEARARFMDKREMILLFGEKHPVLVLVIWVLMVRRLATSQVAEGYITAIEDRGVVVQQRER